MPLRELGYLDPRELLVAEAIQARAWESLSQSGTSGLDDQAAKARLASIVLKLMTDQSKSIGDLSMAAVSAFRDARRD